LLPIDQYWFGHRAEKKTILYIVGINPTELPAFPYVMGRASHVVTNPPQEKMRRERKKAMQAGGRKYRRQKESTRRLIWPFG
jgi:hypothetical protein